ncbi:UNKNOWN [Stylonychia lemnae]|uniref:Uncharacterized protein n=1 Tax=Stylonychia lemnae TaxID=5949 RepID=A0A078ABK1_STYLE|nr:UNKNOWN [Stylonychia lemnae]|eukprot:CDW78957.1 UNKNOWN [Stylonychia lemnae]
MPLRQQRKAQQQSKDILETGIIALKNYILIKGKEHDLCRRIHYSQPFSIVTTSQGQQIQVIAQANTYSNEMTAIYESETLTQKQIDKVVHEINSMLKQYQRDLIQKLSLSETIGFQFKVSFLISNQIVSKFISMDHKILIKINCQQALLCLGNKEIKLKNIKSFDIRSNTDKNNGCVDQYRIIMLLHNGKVYSLTTNLFNDRMSYQMDLMGGLAEHFKKLYLDFHSKKVSYELLKESQNKFLEEMNSRRCPSTNNICIEDGFNNLGNSFNSQKSNNSNNQHVAKVKSSKFRKVSLNKQLKELAAQKLKHGGSKINKDSQHCYNYTNNNNKENINIKNQRKGSDSRKNCEKLYQKIAKQIINKTSRNQLESSSNSYNDKRDESRQDSKNPHKKHIIMAQKLKQAKEQSKSPKNRQVASQPRGKSVESKCQTQRQLRLEKTSNGKRQLKRKPLQEISNIDAGSFFQQNSTPRFNKNNRLQNYFNKNDFSSPLDKAPSKNRSSGSKYMEEDFTLNEGRGIEIEFYDCKNDQNFISHEYRSPLQEHVKAPSDFMLKIQDTEPSFAKKLEIRQSHINGEQFISKQRSFEEKLTEKQITKTGDQRTKSTGEYGLKATYSQKSLLEFQEKMNRNFRAVDESSLNFNYLNSNGGNTLDKLNMNSCSLNPDSKDFQYNLINEMNNIKRELKDTKALLNSTLAQMSRYQHFENNKENIYIPQHIDKAIERTDIVLKNQLQKGILQVSPCKLRMSSCSKDKQSRVDSQQHQFDQQNQLRQSAFIKSVKQRRNGIQEKFSKLQNLELKNMFEQFIQQKQA